MSPAEAALGALLLCAACAGIAYGHCFYRGKGVVGDHHVALGGLAGTAVGLLLDCGSGVFLWPLHAVALAALCVAATAFGAYHGSRGGSAMQRVVIPPAPVTRERQLLADFVKEIDEASEATKIALFGDWIAIGATPVCRVPGIFTAVQALVIVGVAGRDHDLPPSALDDLLPDRPYALTAAQLAEAGTHGIDPTSLCIALNLRLPQNQGAPTP